MFQKSLRGEQLRTTDLAIDYARKTVMSEARGPGDLDPAMHRLEARTGIGYWTWWGLWNRRRKIVDLDLFSRLRGAYLALCERQLRSATSVIEREAAKGGSDDFADLAAEAERLAAKLRAAQARLAARTED